MNPLTRRLNVALCKNLSSPTLPPEYYPAGCGTSGVMHAGTVLSGSSFPPGRQTVGGTLCKWPLPRACSSASSTRLLVRPSLFGDGPVLTGAFPFRSVSRFPDGIGTIKRQTMTITDDDDKPKTLVLAPCELYRTHVKCHYRTPPLIFMSNSSYAFFLFVFCRKNFLGPCPLQLCSWSSLCQTADTPLLSHQRRSYGPGLSAASLVLRNGRKCRSPAPWPP
ncbi:conserved hypothetical protein [Trichinella spiralis]|uniref:hypothetical protein n=1 Tax=Trichinella spiralis TaxID=6334 RepID=UPI0001EFD59F|nr:conserved hypothetical protein [Trichinella spiralis]XP_003369212.1 conserved hypothetical protein [Trichinella spiralis]